VIIQGSQSPDATQFLWANTHTDIGPCLRMIEARSSSGELLGVVAFNGWLGKSCQVHFAMHSPLALRPLMRAGVAYIFGQCRMNAVLGCINASNTVWIAGMKRHFGARELVRVKGGGLGGDDVVILEGRPETCPMWQRMQRRLQEAA
jgi:hypothetical protein